MKAWAMAERRVGWVVISFVLLRPHLVLFRGSCALSLEVFHHETTRNAVEITQIARRWALAFTLRAFGVFGRATNKPVADADDSFDAIAAFVELLPQPADMNIERARVAVVAVAPDVV